MANFRKAALFLRRSATDVTPMLEVIAVLEREGVSYLFEESTAQALGRGEGFKTERLGRECDVVIVVGGDGTTLGIARAMLPWKLPMIAINGGRLGFITAIAADEIEAKLPPILAGQYKADKRAILMARLYRNRECVFESTAVNDAGVTHGSANALVEFAVSVDNHAMSRQRADGVIVASATGSTAYSMACGGPIMHPKIQGMTIVPIAPHSLTSRPIVVPKDSVVQIELIAAHEAQVFCDMQEFTPMRPGDTLCVSSVANAFTLLEPSGHNHYEVLRRKFYWNSMPEDESRGKR